MTSASLSLSNRFSNHKKYVTRTLWSSIIGFLLMAIYYILGVAVMVSRSINYGKIYHQSPEYMYHEMQNAVTKVMGFEQLGWILVVGVAIAFAFQGFSYVFEQKKLDFYLSQPTTRAERMRKTYFKAISTFLIMYISVNAIALLVATCMGAMSRVVLVSVLIETLRSFVLFFTIYNITVLAILLCGSLPIAMLVMAFLMLISVVYGYVFTSYKELFFSTYAARGDKYVIASPLYDRFIIMKMMLDQARGGGELYNISLGSVFECFKETISYDVDILVVGLLAFVCVAVISRFRKAEHAGKAIVFKPFRWIAKILSCVVIGLASGFIFYSMNDYVWNNGSKFFIMMFAIMVLGTVISGCIIEAILDGNIKSFIQGKAQTIMAVAIASLIFVIFKGDLLGYDCYVPSRDKIESCAFIGSGYDYTIYENGQFKDGYNMSEDYMFITDIDSFVELSKAGMSTQKKWAEYDRTGNYHDLGWSETIVYRLKNGRSVYREICIPYDIDEQLLSKLIDSDEYKKGYFVFFHDEDMREFDAANAKTGTVTYISGPAQKVTTDIPYAELSDAYRKDIDKYFTYEMAKDTVPVGQISYDNNTNHGYASTTMNVYDCYTNTIDVLKKYGVFVESTLDVEQIESIEVTNYYPGYDLESQDMDEIDINVESKSITYTEKAQISDIIENVVLDSYYSRWYRRDKLVNNQFSVMINFKKTGESNSNYASYYSFEMGKVPDFVYSDTN